MAPHLILELHSSCFLFPTALRYSYARSCGQHGQDPSRLDVDPQIHLPANHAPIQLFAVHEGDT